MEVVKLRFPFWEKREKDCPHKNKVTVLGEEFVLCRQWEPFCVRCSGIDCPLSGLP